MLAYLIAGVFFILALRGLSSPATSRARQPLSAWRHADCGGRRRWLTERLRFHPAQFLPAANAR
jgi:hypothetical protein